MGYFWEDFTVGNKFNTASINIKPTLVEQFARVSGDDNPLHLNNSSAGESIYKNTIAHGMLITSLFTGMNRKLGILKGTSLGVIHMEWDYLKPVFVGDEIFYCMEIVDKRETSKPDRGILKRKISVYRVGQEDKELNQGIFLNLVKRKR